MLIQRSTNNIQRPQRIILKLIARQREEKEKKIMNKFENVSCGLRMWAQIRIRIRIHHREIGVVLSSYQCSFTHQSSHILRFILASASVNREIHLVLFVSASNWRLFVEFIWCHSINATHTRFGVRMNSSERESRVRQAVKSSLSFGSIPKY